MAKPGGLHVKLRQADRRDQRRVKSFHNCDGVLHLSGLLVEFGKCQADCVTADLLFVTSEGTPPMRGNFRRQVWLPACQRAGIEGVTVRNLRHSAASLMLASGMRDLEVAARLGHSKPSITKDVYARFIPAAEGVSDPYEAMLAGQAEQDLVGAIWEQQHQESAAKREDPLGSAGR